MEVIIECCRKNRATSVSFGRGVARGERYIEALTGHNAKEQSRESYHRWTVLIGKLGAPISRHADSEGSP